MVDQNRGGGWHGMADGCAVLHRYEGRIYGVFFKMKNGARKNIIHCSRYIRYEAKENGVDLN